ncbi:hypothetical protein ACJMK2_041207 [Sinanodonta woodiana]|uniref:Glutathione peroxidase n=1 Tax=Sinanodonta woodiana TaxID=1069815 RepID=A0ABD3W3Z7_SINWO
MAANILTCTISMTNILLCTVIAALCIYFIPNSCTSQEILNADVQREFEATKETGDFGPELRLHEADDGKSTQSTVDDSQTTDAEDILIKLQPDENEIILDSGTADEKNVDTDINGLQDAPDADPTLIRKDQDFFSFTVNDIDGNLVKLDKYRGKVALVVNVASECGYTAGHYRALVHMQSVLEKTNKFVILAFPCNQFGAQEPGTNQEIKKIAEDVYDVNFPMFSKINVLDNDVPKVWQYLIEKSGNAPNWNFWKYLVDSNGQVLKAWGPWIPVDDIFHEVKEVVDNSMFEDESQFPPHGGEL